MIKQVKVCHRIYQVVMRDTIVVDGVDCDGVCRFNDGVIEILTGLDTDLTIETLFHEIAHAVHRVANLDDESTEEEVVTRSSPIWCQVLYDNRELVELFFDRAVSRKTSETS